MDADIISYESMLIARDAANWAFWGMVAAFCSAGATLLAAVIAFLTINSWKHQTRAQEVRNFILAVYNFHTSMIRTPELELGKEPEDLEYELFMQTYKTLSSVYEASLMIQSAKVRGKTSAIFSKLSDVQTKYRNCEISKATAVDKILEIRNSSPLLKASY